MAHDTHSHLSQPPIDASSSGDGTADVIATIALIALVVSGVAYWLSSFPS